MTYVDMILAAVLFGGGLYLEYRYAPLAWVIATYRKVVG